MTREEAIRKTLDTVLWTRNASDIHKNILTDALIKALDQEPILDKIRAEIEQIADEERKHDEKWAIGLRYAVKIIDKYKVEGEE